MCWKKDNNTKNLIGSGLMQNWVNCGQIWSCQLKSDEWYYCTNCAKQKQAGSVQLLKLYYSFFFSIVLCVLCEMIDFICNVTKLTTWERYHFKVEGLSWGNWTCSCDHTDVTPLRERKKLSKRGNRGDNLKIISTSELASFNPPTFASEIHILCISGLCLLAQREK